MNDQPSKQEPKTSYVLKDYSIQEVPDDEVEYEMISPNRLVGTHANAVPLYNNAQSPRLFYAARFLNQAMPLTTREEPLVQALDVEDADGRSFEQLFGERMGAKKAPADGEVISVDGDEIRLKGADGSEHSVSLYNNFQFNRKSQISNKALVKPGDKVKKGQLLAPSNFTDDKGTMSLGRNAYTALVPYKGYSMDDAIVLSRSFADKMASEHVYEHARSKDEDTRFGKDHYRALFPDRFTRDQLENLDDSGVVKPGTVLQKGDPIILATRPKSVSSTVQHLGKLGKVFRNMRTNAAEVWEHDYPGEVMDIADTKKSKRAYIRAISPLQTGDKAIFRNGQKNIDALIIDDEKMPRDSEGKPFDALLNPLSLPSRVNAATLYEMALGKLAKKMGKPIAVPAFDEPGSSRVEKVMRMLEDAGISDTDRVYDPEMDRYLDNPVSTGYAYMMKLHHVVESKNSARGQGAYDINEQPLKGGGDAAQAKRLGGLESTALMSKGAYGVLNEAMTLRGQRCFDHQTEVLTREGWKYWPDVTADDELYTKEKVCEGTAWFEKPTALHIHHYEGVMYGYEGLHVNYLVTPNHNFWGVKGAVSKSKAHYKLKTFTAESLYGKEASFEVFGAIYPGTISDTYTLEFTGKDIGSSRKTTDVSMSIYDYCEFMGWYLSEGSAISEAAGRGRVLISQAKDIHPAEFEKIENLLRRIGIKNYHYTKLTAASCRGIIACQRTIPIGAVTGIRFNSAPLVAHLQQFGRRAWLKRIPETIFEAPLRCRIAFLEAYAAGDGCTRVSKVKRTGRISKNWLICTSSSQMVNDLHKLALLSGYGAWVEKTIPSGKNEYKHDHYSIIISKNRTKATVRKTPYNSKRRGHYKEQYNGMVYCATMRTGLLFVRRNGQCMWSGNSDDYWRQLRQGYNPAPPGTPFVFDKYRALLNGAGFNARDAGSGKLVLGPMTDRELRSRKPVEIRSGATVDSGTLEPKAGGLFDPEVVAGRKWGKITLPVPVPNPAFEKTIQQLLGITGQQLRDVLAGKLTLEDAQNGVR